MLPKQEKPLGTFPLDATLGIYSASWDLQLQKTTQFPSSLVSPFLQGSFFMLVSKSTLIKNYIGQEWVVKDEILFVFIAVNNYYIDYGDILG